MHDTGLDLAMTPRTSAPAASGPIARTLGRTDYEVTWREMRAFTLARTAGSRDEIWITEHPPVYTVGLAGRLEHYPRGESPIPVVKTDRGGQITYHGPGQAVVYTLVDLRRQGRGVRDYVRRLEDAMIRLLGTHGIAAYGKVDAPGVYVRKAGVEAKIGALGLKVAKGCTYHGVALNVAMDLAPFTAIDPCGYRGLAVTQLSDFGVGADVRQVGAALAKCLAESLV
jgi:lipoyl(octanoyl) transferase